MINRSATAEWSGGLKDGKGTLTTQSSVLGKTPFGFKTRFEDSPGTNPEELIAAAHASCFTMALSAQLEAAGMTAQKLETTANVSLNKAAGGWEIPAVHLSLVANIPGASREAFDAAVLKAEHECPVSKLLKATITLDAKLES